MSDEENKEASPETPENEQPEPAEGVATPEEKPEEGAAPEAPAAE